MRFIHVPLLLSLGILGNAAPLSERTTETPLCRNISLPIQAQSRNVVLPPYPDTTAPGAVYRYLASFNVSTLPQAPIQGTYNIAATYCEPSVQVKGRDAIQVLIHGLSATKEYWNGYDGIVDTFPGQYSWVAHAQSQGYATLAIDSLGNGESDHPDPIKVVQGGLQVAIVQKIISQLRNGTLASIPKYSKVVVAGHSYGSIISRLVAQIFPTSGADAYILTSTSNVLTGLLDFIANTRARSASVVLGGRYSNLAPGYQAAAPDSIRDVLYPLNGHFDPKMAAVDAAQPHIFATGEIAARAPFVPNNFTGPVFVITGRQDQIVCGNGNITSRIPDCGVGPGSSAANLTALFPKASQFGSYSPANSSHIISSQYSAPEVFGAAAVWLSSVGF